MSRRTQLTTKYIFQVLAQLSENFIFIYLGLTLFTETQLEFKPLFILITVVGICAARWAAVFPLSKAINWFIRYRAKRRGREVADELPGSYQAMLFWAGLRGAVGVALAAGLTGENGAALRATVLVVVVLTVIIFGGTTARMLEILSDDEFDIETATNGTYYKRAGTAVGHTPRRSDHAVPLSPIDTRSNGVVAAGFASYSSGNNSQSPPIRPDSAMAARKNSAISQKERETATQNLLSRGSNAQSEDEDLDSDSDLPPAAARRSPKRRASPRPLGEPFSSAASSSYPTSGTPGNGEGGESHMTATGAISQLFSGTTDDHAAWFRQLDEGFIKPKLLLDQSKGGSGHGGSAS